MKKGPRGLSGGYRVQVVPAHLLRNFIAGELEDRVDCRPIGRLSGAELTDAGFAGRQVIAHGTPGPLGQAFPLAWALYFELIHHFLEMFRKL